MFSSNTSQVSEDQAFVEDVFSTWLYTGTGATQTITNGIGLSTKGGLVWIKGRSYAAGHALYDTNRGVNRRLITNNTNAQLTETDAFTAFNTNGFTLGPDGGTSVNAAGETLASWTFRKQPKFFDVVTYTGNGGSQTINHSLGATVGCIVIKCTSNGTTSWIVYHRSLASSDIVRLEDTGAAQANEPFSSTSTTFTVQNHGIAQNSTNTSGRTYVAYLFAHNAGGFGLTGTDNVISCGSYTGNGSTTGPTVTLGYEPQWLLIKRAIGGNGPWYMFDNMRGLTVAGQNDAYFEANGSNVEALSGFIAPNATGLQITTDVTELNASGNTYIYIAIRRGPMKTPTTGTSVFSPNLQNGNGSVTTNFPIDLLISREGAGANSTFAIDRLRGFSSTSSTTASWLTTNSTSAENSSTSLISFAYNTGFTASFGAGTRILWSFRRAPGYFDEVCFQGDGGTNRSISHNLGVAPELIITKSRNFVGNWHVGCGLLGWNAGLYLDTTNASSVLNWYSSASATAYVTGSSNTANRNGYDYVVYLFASCPGVSKVGSYAGTGTTLQINCGFTGGARFVLIKRTDSTGDWYVWDSARGIVAGNDPYLLLNSTAAEVTNTDWVDTHSPGFELSNAAGNLVNSNGASYIFLAIA